MNIIGFPGFGIGPFSINPIAFNIPFFGIRIAWYGIIVTFSILCGIFYAFWRGKKSEGISSDDMIDVAIFSIPAAVIGSRIYYIIFNLDKFPTFRSFFAGDGLAVYGAIIAALAAGFGVCKYKKLPVLKLFDATAPAIMLGQVIGRWGNFINAEAHGTATDLPWRMSISGVGEVHPTFLYESLWNLLGFAIINLILYRRKKFDGLIFLSYMIWYGFGRMLIEELRTDSLMLGDFRVSQVLGGLCFIGGIILMIWLASQAKIRALENDPEYKAVYSSALSKLAETPEPGEPDIIKSEETESDETEQEETGTENNAEDSGEIEEAKETEE